MNNKWHKSGNKFIIGETSQEYEVLPKGIYTLDADPIIGIYLSRTADNFKFGYKVYGTESNFIEWVKKSYDKTKGNLGILLNGVKGTGKSVTAKQICNILDLPVIIVHTKYDNEAVFLNKIQQDCIIFFDEYEKVYEDYDHSILTVMDGVLDTQFRKVFLLTTNKKWLNENMLQRPGRLRYVKTFSDLKLNVIEEIVDDLLENKSLRTDVIDYISQLEMITVDIVRCVVEEVNIHDCSPEVFKGFFNTQIADRKVDVFHVDGDKETLIMSSVKCNFNDIEELETDSSINFDHAHFGYIDTILSDDMFIIRNARWVENGKYIDREREKTMIKIVRKVSTHSSFLVF